MRLPLPRPRHLHLPPAPPEELGERARRAPKVLKGPGVRPEPLGQVVLRRRAAEPLVQQDDGAVIVPVPDHPAQRLVHRPGGLLAVPLVPAQRAQPAPLAPPLPALVVQHLLLDPDLRVRLHRKGDSSHDDRSARPVREVEALAGLPPADAEEDGPPECWVFQLGPEILRGLSEELALPRLDDGLLVPGDVVPNRSRAARPPGRQLPVLHALVHHHERGEEDQEAVRHDPGKVRDGVAQIALVLSQVPRPVARIESHVGRTALDDAEPDLARVDHVRVLDGLPEGKLQLMREGGERGEGAAGDDDGAHAQVRELSHGDPGQKAPVAERWHPLEGRGSAGGPRKPGVFLFAVRDVHAVPLEHGRVLLGELPQAPLHDLHGVREGRDIIGRPGLAGLLVPLLQGLRHGQQLVQEDLKVFHGDVRLGQKLKDVVPREGHTVPVRREVVGGDGPLQVGQDSLGDAKALDLCVPFTHGGSGTALLLELVLYGPLNLRHALGEPDRGKVEACGVRADPLEVVRLVEDEHALGPVQVGHRLADLGVHEVVVRKDDELGVRLKLPGDVKRAAPSAPAQPDEVLDVQELRGGLLVR